MKNDEPVHALIAGASNPDACPAITELARAATIYVCIRVEERYLNIRTWPRPMLARYVEIEIECFVREWRIALAEADLPRLTRAVVAELGRADGTCR